MNQNFLRYESQNPDLTTLRFILGIIVGLFFCFSFYSLLFMVREVYRIISVTDNYSVWILSDEEVQFYNLVLAFISAIIAQSVTFTFWLHKPKHFFGEKNLKKKSILHEQITLNWYFLFFYSKLAQYFAVYMGLVHQGAFYIFSLYPDYKYLFILLIIIHFLQTWLTLRLKFKRNGFKWMMISALVISVVAFVCSRINLIDYNTINQGILNSNFHYKYDLSLPETNSYIKLYKKSLITNLYVVEGDLSQGKPKVSIFVNRDSISLDQLQNKITEL